MDEPVEDDVPTLMVTGPMVFQKVPADPVECNADGDRVAYRLDLPNSLGPIDGPPFTMLTGKEWCEKKEIPLESLYDHNGWPSDIAGNPYGDAFLHVATTFDEFELRLAMCARRTEPKPDNDWNDGHM